jgi:hypothetical protein
MIKVIVRAAITVIMRRRYNVVMAQQTVDRPAQLEVRELHDLDEIRTVAKELSPERTVVLVGRPGSDRSLQALRSVFEAWAKQRRTAAELVDALMPRFQDLPGQAAVLQARRNAEARRDLLESYGAVTSGGVAELAGSKAKNRAALANRWRSEGRVFAVPVGDELVYPLFQFSEEGRPLPVVAETLAALDRSGDLSAWQRALWFASANGWLAGRRPVELLERDPDAVVEAARREAELVS